MSRDGGLDPAPAAGCACACGSACHVHVYTHVCAPTLACICRGMYVYFTTVSENTPSWYWLSSLSRGFFCCLNAFINKTSDKYSVPRGEGRVASKYKSKMNWAGTEKARGQGRPTVDGPGVGTSLPRIGRCTRPVAPLTWMQNFSFHLNAFISTDRPPTGKVQQPPVPPQRPMPTLPPLPTGGRIHQVGALLSLMLPRVHSMTSSVGRTDCRHLSPTAASEEKLYAGWGIHTQVQRAFVGDEILVIFIHSVMLFITGIFSLP